MTEAEMIALGAKHGVEDAEVGFAMLAVRRGVGRTLAQVQEICGKTLRDRVDQFRTAGASQGSLDEYVRAHTAAFASRQTALTAGTGNRSQRRAFKANGRRRQR